MPDSCREKPPKSGGFLIQCFLEKDGDKYYNGTQINAECCASSGVRGSIVGSEYLRSQRCQQAPGI